MFALCLAERLQRDQVGWKRWSQDPPRVCVCVWMSCSHAMIILCGACTVQTVSPSPPPSVEQSAHCVMCRATAVIMAIMSSRSQIGSVFFIFYFFTERTAQSDREEGWRSADLLHSCRVGWICARTGRKRITQQMSLCTFCIFNVHLKQWLLYDSPFPALYSMWSVLSGLWVLWASSQQTLDYQWISLIKCVYLSGLPFTVLSRVLPCRSCLRVHLLLWKAFLNFNCPPLKD